jgi:hypothetical protein
MISGPMIALHNDASPRRYYIGAKTAPVLTLVIGGNHEASNYMWELYVICLSLVMFLVFILG